MNKKILGIFGSLLVLAMLATPVMAIGPFKAQEVGNNPNLATLGSNLLNRRGEAGGVIVYILNSDDVWIKWNWFDASAGRGKFKNAIEAGPGTVNIFSAYEADQEAFLNGESRLYENKWIFMSPEGSGKQMGGHGMVYWMFWGIAIDIGIGDPNAYGAMMAAFYPDGVFWRYNMIK